MYSRQQRVPLSFEPDERPGADLHVYCKGCGAPLEGELRHMPARTRVTIMMCEPCRKVHKHELIPTSGSPTFCYRCGEPDEIFVEQAVSPITHHVCPRCVPERAARYRSGKFTPAEPVPVEPAAAAAAPAATTAST
jgi:hypothetical protein